MEFNDKLFEGVTLGNFIDSNTFLDDDGNPIPLIKSDMFDDLEDKFEDDEETETSSKEKDSQKSDNKQTDSKNSDGNEDSDNKFNNNSSDDEFEDDKFEDDKFEDDNDIDKPGYTGKSTQQPSNKNDEQNKKGNSGQESEKSSDNQNKGSQSSKNQKNDKINPEIFNNPPKIIHQGDDEGDEEGQKYDLDEPPLVYRNKNKNQNNNKKENDKKDDNKEKKKIAPNPNKIYVDTKTGKSYKFDYSLGKFIQVNV